MLSVSSLMRLMWRLERLEASRRPDEPTSTCAWRDCHRANHVRPNLITQHNTIQQRHSQQQHTDSSGAASHWPALLCRVRLSSSLNACVG